MDRRSKVVRGVVNFPINSQEYVCTGEGGLFVKLVATTEEDWMVCCGGFQRVEESECHVGSDKKSHEHSYLCIMTIGSTGWSGYSDKAGTYWTCTFDDLTEEGKRLYKAIQALYPDCKLYLQTFLDT